jgi:putative acetyltransferase
MPQTQKTAPARIRPLREQHIPDLLTLFEQSVRRMGPEHYSPQQVEQWALGARHPGLVSQLCAQSTVLHWQSRYRLSSSRLPVHY